MKTLHLFLKRSHTHERLCAVSDGVYAIALTLLVLDLKVPEVPGITDSELTQDLVQQVPNFVAYTVGFLLIARFWVNHHRIFQSAVLCDEWALGLNLVHLFFISLTPYAASLIGHYEGDRIAAIIFSSNLGLSSLSLTVLGHYVLAREEWRNKESDGTWAEIPWWTAYTGPGVALGSIVLSFLSIEVALLFWLVLPLRDLILLTRLSRSQDRRTHQEI
ncbi:MAG: TMEM175 family protein [Nitrospira sp.]|nr:TMEM175 family protein [Nitrospira sp.]